MENSCEGYYLKTIASINPFSALNIAVNTIAKRVKNIREQS